jgi:hypothetical protein
MSIGTTVDLSILEGTRDATEGFFPSENDPGRGRRF